MQSVCSFYRGHKNPLLSQINPFHPLASYLFNFYFNIIILSLGLPSGLCLHVSAAVRTVCPIISQPFFIALVIVGEECRSWISSPCSFVRSHFTTFLPSAISSSCLNTPSLCSSFTVTDRKAWGKFPCGFFYISLHILTFRWPCIVINSYNKTN